MTNAKPAPRKGVIDTVDPTLEAVAEVAEPTIKIEEDIVEQDEIPDDEEPDEIDPNEPIFENGPTYSMVEYWKDQFGDVYVTSFAPDNHIVWRTLTRFEYRTLVKALEMSISTGQVTQAEANLNNEEQICEKCILFPQLTRPQLANEMAGVASIIAQEVMEASGFVAMDVRQL